jgi:mRNA interferase MazF
MHKDFDTWNKTKKGIDAAEWAAERFPKEREVWMALIGKNVGYEQNGSGDSFGRPVLVVKKFNNQMFWVVPLSTKQKKYDFYFNFTDPQEQPVAAILAQMRLMSVKRFKRNMYEIPETLFEEVRTRISGFLNSKPRTGRGFSEPEGTL